MPYLTDLADACRKSGLRVVEVSGWQTRGHGPMSTVETIVAHHTATPKTAPGDYPSLRIVRDGRPGLPGPLAQLGLGRDGTVYVIAAGVSYHAGETWTVAQNNWHAIGIEAEHDGLSAWPADQYAAYARLCKALCQHYRLAPSDVRGHKEVAAPAGRKIDPNFDMGQFRNAVAEATTGDDDMPNYTEWSREDKAALTQDVSRAVLREKVKVLNAKGKPVEVTIKQAIARTANGTRRLEGDVDDVLERLDELNGDA